MTRVSRQRVSKFLCELVSRVVQRFRYKSFSNQPISDDTLSVIYTVWGSTRSTTFAAAEDRNQYHDRNVDIDHPHQYIMFPIRYQFEPLRTRYVLCLQLY